MVRNSGLGEKRRDCGISVTDEFSPRPARMKEFLV
jgi:hypothetical protein